MTTLEWSGELACPVIGVLHLPPLPGAPRFEGDRCRIADRVLADARALKKGGVDALIVENFGDAPFFPGRVPAEVVASMAALAMRVRLEAELPLGINVLRNDGVSALAIAQAVEAEFVRVNVLGGARVADQGVIQGIAHDLLRDRARLHVNEIQVLADVAVKHSAPLAARAVEHELLDLIQRGGADGVIVTGDSTGGVTDVRELRDVKQIAERHQVPVLVGSGVRAENVEDYLPWADGLIVGTTFKRGGNVENPIEQSRVEQFMERVRSQRRI